MTGINDRNTIDRGNREHRRGRGSRNGAVVLLAITAQLVSACGSRLSGSALTAAEGSGSGGSTGSGGASGSGASGTGTAGLPGLADLPARRPGAPVDRRAEPPEAPVQAPVEDPRAEEPPPVPPFRPGATVEPPPSE